VIKLLQLMQLSDSALPIGAAAHSFGLESLADWGLVNGESLRALVSSYLQEQALVEACYGRAAFTAALDGGDPGYLCQRFSALKQARETREGSICLGRRLLTLCSAMVSPRLSQALEAKFHDEDAHHVIAFGYISALLGFDEDSAVAAFLQQTVASIVSSAQRLMPVGQRQAAFVQWAIKNEIVDITQASRSESIWSVGSFMPLLDIASLRHPRLETRLFLS